MMLTLKATIMAIRNPSPIRKPAISKSFPKAMYVEAMTMGLIRGPVSIKPIAAYTGTPLDISRRMMGTIPHSHAGKRAPATQLMTTAAVLFFGIHLFIWSSVMKIWIKPAISTPIRTKGNASIRMLIKITFRFNREGGYQKINLSQS